MLQHHQASTTSGSIARKQKSSTAIHQVFNPTRGIRDEICRRGGVPKNHILENARHLKSLQEKVQHRNRVLLDQATAPLPSSSLYRNVPSRLYLSEVTPHRIRHQPNTTESRVTPNKIHSAPVSTNPSTRRLPSVTDGATAHTAPSSATANPRKTKIGQLPAYLVQRKQEWHKRDEEKVQEKLRLKSWPPGTVPVPEEERLATLEYLDQSLKELNLELSRFPITLAPENVQKYNRQQQVLKKIHEVERGIQVYQQPQVFMAV